MRVFVAERSNRQRHFLGINEILMYSISLGPVLKSHQAKQINGYLTLFFQSPKPQCHGRILIASKSVLNY